MCFAKHKQSTSNKKSIWERKICCVTCGAIMRGVTHDCSKRYCETFKQDRVVGHLTYMRLLKDVLPVNADKVLYVFYDFETTQNNSDTAKANVPNLFCVQLFCTRCEDMEDGSIDCEQ